MPELIGCREPWQVARIRPSSNPPRLFVWLSDIDRTWPCPSCGREAKIFDRSFPQLFRKYIHPRIIWVIVCIPIVKCPSHGLQQVTVPWTARESKWIRVTAEELDDYDLPFREDCRNQARSAIGIADPFAHRNATFDWTDQLG